LKMVEIRNNKMISNILIAAINVPMIVIQFLLPDISFI